MPVSAQEHRVRTGLYSSCKGVWLSRHKTKHFSPTTETRSRREVTEYDTFDLQIIGFFVTVMLLVPLMYTAFIVTMTILEVLLQIRLSTDKGAVHDISHQARLDLSWVLDIYHLVIKICSWLVQHRQMVTLFSLLCVFLISTVTAVVCLIIRHRYKQTVHRVVIVLQGAKIVDVQKVSTGHSSQRLMCVSYLVAILTAILISLMLIKSGDVELNPGPITGATVLEIDTNLRPIHTAIFEARSKWKSIARALGLADSDIRDIRDQEDDNGERLYEMLSLWIQTGTATIHDLLAVLEHKTVNQTSLANEIRSLRGKDRADIGLNAADETNRLSLEELTPVKQLSVSDTTSSYGPTVTPNIGTGQQAQAYPQNVQHYDTQSSLLPPFTTRAPFSRTHITANQFPQTGLGDQNMQPFTQYDRFRSTTGHPHTAGIQYSPYVNPAFNHSMYPNIYYQHPVFTPPITPYQSGAPTQSHQPSRLLYWAHKELQLTAASSFRPSIEANYEHSSVGVVNQGVCSQGFTTSIPQAHPQQPQQLMASSQPLQYPQVATPTPTLQVCEQTFTQQAPFSTFQTPYGSLGQPAGTAVSYSQTHSDGLSYSTPRTCSQLESMDVEYPQEPFDLQRSSDFDSQQVQTQHDVITDTQSPSTRSLRAKRQTHERCPEAKKIRLAHHQSITENCLGSQSYSTTSTDGHTQIPNTLTGRSTSQQDPSEPPPLSFPRDFSLVYNDTLYPACSNWYNLGLALNLPPSTLKEISSNNRGITGDCLREVLDTRMKKLPKLTWREIIEALRQQSIDERELALRIERKYYPHRAGHSEGSSPLDQMQSALSGELTLEELCSLPVENVWHSLGLWLGVEERRLWEIKKSCQSKNSDNKVQKMFEVFIVPPVGTTKYNEFIRSLPQEKQTIVKNIFESKVAQKLDKYKQMISQLLPEGQRKIGEELLQEKLSKYQHLVRALVKVGKREIAEEICAKKGVSLTDYLAATDPASNPPECVVRYASYLKDRYKQMSVLPDDDWPPPITSKQHFTNLALIERKRQCPLPDAKLLKTMEYDYAHGNVDNIVDRKQRIEFEQVFLPIIDESSKESRLTILMDGAPGVGKTTITRKVCIDWANGKILQEYQLVIFVPLREVTLNQVENHTITDLLPADDPELKAQIIKHIQKSSGTNIMFLFDGFDELSTQQRTRQSLFLDIIKGNTLHHCSVLVTSRSYASGPLKDLYRVNRHVEVLGFDKKQIKNCIKQNIAQKDKADQLLQMLKDRLDITSLCYIPLNCRIVLYVYSVEFTLPDTLTQLYDIFILHTIKHHARKIALNPMISVDIEEIRQAKNFQALPDSVQSHLDSLSQIAFSGMQEDKLVFEYAELKNSKDTLSLGLLNSIETFTQVGVLQYYQFLHLTIQEFLATRYIASDKMSAEDRLTFLKTNVENERFRMTLLFLAGLTHFDFLPPKEAFPGEKTIDLKERSDTRRKDKPDKEKFLFLAQLFYETRASCCDWLLSSLCSKSFNMSWYSLTQFDCLVLVHFLSTTPQDHIWEVIDLKRCNITVDRFRILSADHTKKPGVPAISMTKVLSLECSNRSNEVFFVDFLLPIVAESTYIAEVNLSKTNSPNQEDCSDVVKLAESLVNKNRSLQKVTINTNAQCQDQTPLHLSRNELILPGGFQLVCPKSFQLFLKCTSVEQLEVLSFSRHSEAFQDCPHCGGSGNDAVTSLCQQIDKTTNLQNIYLPHCELSDQSITSIFTSLSTKTTLKSVNVDGNSISVQAVERLVKLLPISTKLTISELELTVDDQTHLHVCVQHHGLSSLRELLHHNKSIVVLDARYCGLTDDVLKEISDYLSHKSSLRELNISGNYNITSEVWKQFFRALQHSTTDVQHSYQSRPAVKVTSKKITCNFDIERIPPSNQSLEILNVSKCNLTDEVLGYIATCLTHNITLTELHLEGNRSVTSVGWIQLFRVLQKGPTAIRKLIINDNKLETESVRALGEMLCNHKHFEMLGVRGCFSSDYSFEIFTDGLSHSKTLKEIDISYNRRITSKGWVDFFRALRSTDCITTLDISHNSFGCEELSALRELLHHNKSIVVLNASFCDLTDDVLKYISDFLSHKSSMRELDISLNKQITIEGWEQFFRALQHNTSLRKLNIEHSGSFTSDQRGKVVIALSEMISHNKGISKLTIDEDFINNEYVIELFARALLQNTTLQLLRVPTRSNAKERFDNEIKRLRQEEGIVFSPDWNLKIVNV